MNHRILTKRLFPKYQLITLNFQKVSSFDMIVIHRGLLIHPVKDSCESGLVFSKKGFFVLFLFFYFVLFLYFCFVLFCFVLFCFVFCFVLFCFLFCVHTKYIPKKT